MLLDSADRKKLYLLAPAVHFRSSYFLGVTHKEFFLTIYFIFIFMKIVCFEAIFKAQSPRVKRLSWYE